MKTRIKSAITLFALSAVLCAVATGCKNTANGMGRDMERAGEKIQEKTN